MAEEKTTARPLEDVLRELFPELPENFAGVISGYMDAIQMHGPYSEPVQEYYRDAVRRYPSIQEWLDGANEAAESPFFQILR